MDDVVSKIEDKRKSGLLTDEDADDLIHMVATRRNPPSKAWSYSSDCYTDDDIDDYNESGWNRSGVSC